MLSSRWSRTSAITGIWLSDLKNVWFELSMNRKQKLAQSRSPLAGSLNDLVHLQLPRNQAKVSKLQTAGYTKCCMTFGPRISTPLKKSFTPLALMSNVDNSCVRFEHHV